MKWVIGVFGIHNVRVEKNKQKDGNSQNLKGAASDWDVTVGNVTVASHTVFWLPSFLLWIWKQKQSQVGGENISF